MKSRRKLLWISLFLFVVVVSGRPAASMAEGCGIGLVAEPQVLNYPSGSLPPDGERAFGEVFNVNYSSDHYHESLSLQYFDGSGWVGLQNFTGNVVGFTEVDAGVSSGWAGFGDNEVRVVGGSCSSNVATLSVRADQSSYLVDVGIYGAVISLMAVFMISAKKLGWKASALLAGAVYLAIAPFTGQRYDIYFLLSSGIRMLQHVNPFDAGNPAVYPGALKWAYPPLYTVYSAFSFLVYQAVTGAHLPSVAGLTYPGWLTSTYSVFRAYQPQTLPVLVLLLKLPMVASALLTGLLLKQMTGKQSAAIWWVVNPLVVLVAAVWGQLDPVATLFTVAALYAHQRGKPYHAYLFASLGAAAKVWPILLIPILFSVYLRKHGREAIRPLVAVVPALAGTVGLYSLYGSPLQSFFVLVYARAIPTFAGAFSVNGLTWQQILFVLKVPPVPLFLLVAIPAFAAILVRMYSRRDEDIVKWLVVSILVFYLTYNYVNPQYFYWILPLLILQGRKLEAALFTALPVLYVALAYNIFYFVSPAILPNEFAFGASVVEQLKVQFFYQIPFLFVLIAGLVPTVVYLWALWSQLKTGHKPAEATGKL